MQRSPVRKSPRLQAAMSQNISSTPAGENIVEQDTTPVLQPHTSGVHISGTTTNTASPASRETNVAVSSQNISTEAGKNMPPLLPGPNVRLQAQQASLSSNVSTDTISLQRQIEVLQAQLLNTQRALKAAETTNTPNNEQNMPSSVCSTPFMIDNNIGPEHTADRRNPTPYSLVNSDVTVPPDCRQLTAQSINAQPGAMSMQMQRRIYDLPEFDGAVEDWPMFLSAFEHSTAAYLYSHFENCLRLQRALKGEAKECVKSLLIHPNNVPTVIEQLKLQYGRPELLIRCQLQQIKEIQPITEYAIEKLVPFSVKVRNLAAFLETANGQQHLSNPTLMEELVQKLPMSKRLDWAQFASTLHTWPTVLDFSTWLHRVASLVRSIQVPNLSDGRANKDVKRKVVLHATEDNEKKLKCNYCAASHKIYECKKFLAISVPNRWVEVKKLKLCFSCLGVGHSSRDCRRKKQCQIENCQRKHNKLLHELRSEVSKSELSAENSSSVEPMLNCVSSVCGKSDLLFRVVPVVLYGENRSVETYALLDEGSSVTMIDSSLVRELGLQGRQSKLNLSWYGGKSAQEPAVLVDLYIGGVNKKRRYALNNVYGVTNIKLPSQTFNAELIKKHKIPINSYECVSPKLLIGLDHCHLGLPDEIVPLENGGPYAVNTPLGWVVFGNMKGIRPGTHTCLLTAQSDNLNNLVASYFETENFGVKSLPIIESNDDLRARDLLKTSTKRVAGRFVSRLLWRNDDVVLPDSYSMALNRLVGMERKIKNNPQFGEAYKKIINEYVKNNYARKISSSEVEKSHSRTWYLPHFGVKNPNKPGKIRLVFDAAAKVEGVSLNSMLLKGPQQYKPLPSVLFNFRVGAVAVCGDIKEMFHQIIVAEEDRCSQRFLWRENDKGPPDVYEMLVMTFGAACSPCIASYVKERNALEFQDRFPRAVKSVLDHHYVDDFVDSFENSSKAIQIAKQVREIHEAAAFHMRNFTSNSSEVIMALEGNLNHTVSFSAWSNELESTEKVLGMFWDPKEDAFKFNLKFHRVNADIINGTRCPTKRELLCVVMSIFDPIGFLCNFMITAKLLLREVWRHGILWDEKLSEPLNKMWNNWRDELKTVVHAKVQRCYFVKGLPMELELHIFVDASEDAFGAVAYWRYKTIEEKIGVSFISAKTKCAPMKLMSIPRLELQAAVLGTRLMCTVLKEHEIKISRRICWSDSTTVINWIGSESRRYKPFVAHRITEILDSTCPDNWRWLPTDMNVADDCTRIKHQTSHFSETRWFHGPQFLYKPEDDWPKTASKQTVKECEEELRPKFNLLVSTNTVINFNRFSSFLRLIRTMAWVLRFQNRCRKRRLDDSEIDSLSAKELQHAETVLCRISQEEGFAYEIDVLSSGRALKKDHMLFQLLPYLDENQLLRLSGRVDAATWLPLDARSPIILPSCHRLTELYVAYVHNKMRHQNFEATMGEIRRKYWIPRLRSLLRKTCAKCNLCKIRRVVPVNPLMGSLPSDRLTPYVRPFTYTGVDYFGPINITIGRRHEKRWVALFTCLTIRAIHLEVAYDLSTDACILAIRNFINRRGLPRRIRSDNGKNFVGADQEAKRFSEVFDMVQIQDELSSKGIEWRFNCPHNPAEGGIWERMVQCVKKVLKITLKEVAPKEHTLQSFLIEAENILNSRPLTHLPVSHEDEEPLTPNHFLLGSANTAQTPEGTEIERPTVLKKQWRIARQMRDHFWKRWINEYLPTLTRRSKWCQRTKPLAVGDLVLICDPSVSRRDWKRGRVEKLYKGRDGVIRRADIRTCTGKLMRPVSKLSVLDVE